MQGLSTEQILLKEKFKLDINKVHLTLNFRDDRKLILGKFNDVGWGFKFFKKF